jgi:HAMP domain-containing protein
MTLLVRINLALTACFVLAALAAGGVCHVMLQANAKREVMREAALMVDSALAMRAYTSEEIDPLLSAQMAQEFLPQSVPFYAATQNFLKLREHRPEYAYREATLNPSNPRDRATDWEADIVQQFRNDPHTGEIVGERDTPTGRSLYLARPIAAEPECLMCHSLPSSAPATLLARYGSSNGFGWQPHEIVGAQIISVPLAAAISNSERIFRNVMGVIIAILGVALLMVNVVLYFAVVRPVRRMAHFAEEVSLGNSAQGEFPARGSTELVQLARSFNRMRTSLVKALKMLEG